MARDKLVVVNILNIAMNPIHSQSMYHEQFKKIFDKKITVRISGEKYGTLNSLNYVNPEKPELGIYGFFYKFTKLQLDKWYNLSKEDYASPEELKKINIPAHLVPNAEKFCYIFYPQHHCLIFQSAESSRKFSPNLARIMFEQFFNDKRINDDNIFTSVSLVQSEISLTNIYNIPILSKMEITINRPNADFDDADESEVYNRMNKQNVKRWQTILKSHNKENILPDEQTKKLAKVALSNGKVEATGYDDEGMKIEESTTQHPLSEQYTYNPNKEDFIQRFLLKAREFLNSFLGL